MNLTSANQYFASRLKSSAWDNASDADKSKALDTADRQLKSPYYYRLDSEKYWNAVYEQAIWLIQGDVRAALQLIGVTSSDIGNASEDYSLRGRPSFIAPYAWVFCSGSSGVKAGGLR